MKANHQFRIGYTDARAAMSLANKLPDSGNMNKLFKVKGKDYEQGFRLGLKAIAKEKGQA